MSNTNLLSCPFCGSTKVKINGKRTHSYESTVIEGRSVLLKNCSVSVRCNSCHARGPVVSIKVPDGIYNEKQLVEQAVLDAWNNREPIKALIVSLEKFRPEEDCCENKEDFLYFTERHNKYINKIKEVGGLND